SDHLCALMNAGLMETAAAPVWGRDDQVVGVLVVGWEVSNGVAAEKADKLGMALAIVQNDSVYSTSFSTDAEREQLSQEIKVSPAKVQLKKVYAQKKATQVFELAVDGDTYWAFPATMLDAPKDDRLAYLFLASKSKGGAWQDIKWLVALFILGTILCLIVIGVLLENHFVKPIIEIEEGVLKIINGDTDYRFDVVSDEVGGLSYRINQLVNALTLQDEAPEDNEEETS
ncbi:MAG: hypothetical protein JXX14_00680, partial [Deltaproteobacteria bacterium]|nr:hypothetical protein [Deltaproteobacteria bacterium]